MTDPVTYDVQDGIATLTLARPDAMNSLDTPTKESLLAAVTRAAADADARVVVITGSGKAFCVGQDLKEHTQKLQAGDLEELWSTVERHYSPIALEIATMPKPVVASVNGAAAGAGMSIAMACDWRVVADTASFSTAFAGIGLSCDTGSSWTLPRLVGQSKAMELLLWPRKVDANEALEIGLANWVVPADELAAETASIAGRLAVGPTAAFAAIKQAVAFSATHSLEESLRFEGTQMAATGSTEDHRNAVAAFMAKEKPTFTGH